MIKIEIYDACIVACEAETNGFCGGDAGHGGELNITFKDFSNCIDAKKRGDDLVLSFKGDAEMKCAISIFKFLANNLDDEFERVNGNERL